MRVRLLLGVLLALASSPAVAASGPWHRWRGTPTGVFRTATVSRGEWIATNGIGQALGPNTDGKHRTDYFASFDPQGDDPTHINRDLYNALTYDFFGAHRSTHNGDYTLPDGVPEGTGDLAEVRLAADRRFVYARFLWNSLAHDSDIATLTFGGAGSRVRAWPRGARLSSSYSQALTVWGAGAALGARRVAARVVGHAYEVRIPRAWLPRGVWRVTGGSGLGDPAHPGRYRTVDGPTNVWDLLLARDRPWTFDERAQSDLLEAGRAAPPVAVDLRSRPARVPTGDLSRMFSSRLFEADGIRKDAGVANAPSPPAGAPVGAGFNETWLYRGRLQWYGMHVPTRYTPKRRWPLIIYLHGFTGLPDEAFYNPVGLVDTADRNGYIVATPLGRGDYTYKDEGDLDVIEVLRDVERHYAIDPDRVYLMGHSMGGYGTNNVAAHHPDLFAAVAPAQGTDSADLHRNLRNLPWFEISSLQDLDAGARDARALYGSLSDDGYDATLLVYAMKIHEYSSIYDTLPRLFRFFAAHRRVRNPAIVTWTRPVGDHPRWRLVYDGAYWLHGVRGRGATVTVESDAIPHRRPNPSAARRTTTQTADPGPTNRTAATLYETTPAFGAAVPRRNVLHVDAAGTTALRVDLRRARLHMNGLTVDVHTDHALTLHLGRRTLHVPAGHHTRRT